MRFELISNSRDAFVGMRLAGILGTLVRTEDEAKKALANAVQKDDVAIILINEGLATKMPNIVNEFKNSSGRPRIVVIPDGQSGERSTNSITKYIEEAIGLKM